MRLLMLIILFIGSSLGLAQDLPPHETITLQAADDINLVADFYPAPTDSAEPPVVMLLHMLNSNRSAYEPLIPDLHEAGYAILNIDMRGHGDSGVEPRLGTYDQ